MAAGRSTARLSRRLGAGDGGVAGGRVALMLQRDLLDRLSAGRTVVLVTGTNGKTTTAHLLAAALRTAGPVAHNATGANMLDGVAAALMGDPTAPTAVLEVDELHLPEAVARLRPAIVVLLNLSRDQLDRGSEVASVARVVRGALESEPTLVVANCDDALVASVTSGLPRVLRVAAGSGWTEDATAWPDPVEQPSGVADWWLDGRVAVGPPGRVPLEIQLPGRFNDGNAVMALAAATALCVPADRSSGAMVALRSVAGRYGSIRRGNGRLHLLLAKNPAGWRETLPLLAAGEALLLAVNAREPDGRDTSWLWDVPFEDLPPAPVVASGEAAADLGLRLSYAGVEHRTQREPLVGLHSLPPGDVTVVANYSAFAELLRHLHDAP
jgi:UDP-N-acetylmuramyl tripeptide synthase